MKPWLDPIPWVMHDRAIAALESRDASGFLILASNVRSLELVFNNWELLKSLGIYEEALLDAFVASSANNYGYPLWLQRWLFKIADRAP